MKQILLLFLTLLFPFPHDAANILLVTPLGSKSHKNFYMGTLTALAERGHQVHVVSAYRNSKPIKNINDIVLETGSIDTAVKDVLTQSPLSYLIGLLTQAPPLCVDSLLSEEIQTLKKEKIDLVIMSLFFSECYLALIHHFKVPFAFISPLGMYGPYNTVTGNIGFPSFSPNKFTEALFPLGFGERFQSVLMEMLLIGIFKFITTRNMEIICRERGACPNDMPSFDAFYPNVSLIILNGVQALEIPPRPIMPNTIFVGGIHCVPAKPLPKELEEWFKGSGDDGVIYFSLGSAIKPSGMLEKNRKILINVFGSLKQRVLWKWDLETMEDLPPNVRLGEWLPQQDILAHPKTKLFITHGGLQSTTEATYHGCPILGIPVFADQHSNINGAKLEGWAEMLHWHDLNEKTARDTIMSAVNNKRLRDVVKKRGIVMNDQMMKPKEVVTYWIEYVLRHKGANHLKSPVYNMPLYVLYNMDVWVTICGILLAIMLFIFYIIKCLFNRCFKRSQNKKQKNKRD